jgi:diaminohydroxyphosphoribosylaminopyrimidine deaminase/5-amino-6-(5-phosphoribosylamino)uracil reductase
MRDPNPKVRGGGCEFLKAKGIRVSVGVMEKECRRLNEAFTKFVTSDRPFVIVKSAQTLDGWTATRTGHSKWITNEKSRDFVHRLRGEVDAVMVGVGTVIADNPLLTARPKRGRSKDPLRIVVDTHLRTPLDSKVLNHGSKSLTLLAAGSDVEPDSLKKFHKQGVSAIRCPVKAGGIDLEALMAILGKMPVISLMVEGGASIIGSFIRNHLVDKYLIFKSPKILGGDDGVPMAAGPSVERMEQCSRLTDIRVRRFDNDILIEGYPEGQS